jgi:pimeloyl-ACP methyl ester carboxylesterase
VKKLADHIFTHSGHDWGAALVYRIALWQPQLVTHIFCVCVPYTPPKSTYISVEELAARLPSYTYMLQNASGEVERAVMNTIQIKQFLSG